MASQQPRGFVMGLIVGLLLGLALALGVALYVNKVPAPFVNKVPHRTAEQDAAEAEKNKNWDPNAPLAGKTPMRPASAPVTPLPPRLPHRRRAQPKARRRASPRPALLPPRRHRRRRSRPPKSGPIRSAISYRPARSAVRRTPNSSVRAWRCWA